MADDPNQETDPREKVEGPGSSELAPAGNSKARIFVPSEPPAEETQDQEPQGEPGHEEPDSEPEPQPEAQQEEPKSGQSFPVAAVATTAAAGALGAGVWLAAQARARRNRTPLARLTGRSG